MKFVGLLKNSLDEQKLQIESCLLNVVNKPPQSHLMTVTHKQQQLEHIEFLITQGKINLAIEQVSEDSLSAIIIVFSECVDVHIIIFVTLWVFIL